MKRGTITNTQFKNINEIIDFVCDNLKIKKPKIVYSREVFKTDTQMAAYNFHDEVLYLSPRFRKKLTFDAIFAVVHELRHKYQVDIQHETFLDYKSSDQCKSVDEYNLQKVELDANAYAYIFMTHFYGVEPLNFSDVVIKAIYERCEYISNGNY